MNKAFLFLSCMIATIPAQASQIAKTHEAQEQKASSVSVLHDYELFCAVQKIGIALFDLIQENNKDATKTVYFKDMRWSRHHSLHHTKQGIFLELRYHCPVALWTPWGVANLTEYLTAAYNGNDVTGIQNQFLQLIDARMHVASTYTGGLDGWEYSVYQVQKIDGYALPEAIEEEAPDDSAIRNARELVAKDAWKELEGRYKKEHCCPFLNLS